MQRPWAVVAVVGALAVVGAGIGVATQLGGGTSNHVVTEPTTTPTTTPTGAPPTSVPTSSSTSQGVPQATKSPPPVEMQQSVDLSWVSVDDGFALVTSTCGSSTCSRLLRTSDGGRTWSDRHATGLPRACSTACGLRVRFADKSVGYVFGAGLVMTRDGGRTWTKQPGPDTHGLEIAGGTAVRVVERSACPGCAFSVQRSQVGSSTWHTVYRSADVFAGAQLARQGDDVAVNFEKNTAGGAADAHSILAISRDGGMTWTKRRDPCGGSPPNHEADAGQLSWSQHGLLVVLCQPRVSGASTLLTSSDGGRTYSRPVGFGSRTHADLVAAGSGVLLAQTWQADAQGRFVTRPGHGPEVVLERSTDGGRTWTRVSRAALPDGAQGSYLAFSTSRVVTWVPPRGNEVRRSTDAGRTWTSYALR